MDEPLSTRFALYMVPFIFAYGPFVATISLIALIVTRFYYVTLLYIAYRIWDHKSPHSRGWTFGGLLRAFAYMREYFPCDLAIVDASNFEPSKNYIFCGHPHGIFPVGATLNVSSNDIKEQLGLESAIVVLPAFFHVPLLREFLLAFGFSASSLDNLKYILQNRTGHAVFAWAGGIHEIAMFEPHSMRVRTSAVRGYAKLALQHGAQLVPVISFGENDLFSSTTLDKMSWIRKVSMQLFEAATKIRFPLFYGRGFEGMILLRAPVTTVVGKPIASRQFTNPSFDDVQDLYFEYCQALKDLYYENRHLYGYSNVDIEFCMT